MWLYFKEIILPITFGVILLIFIVGVLLIVNIVKTTELREDKTILTLLAKRECIVKESENRFSYKFEEGYYTDITISIPYDSTLSIICWGDRTSWRWEFIKDTDFFIDIQYNSHKRINCTNYRALYNYLKTLKLIENKK